MPSILDFCTDLPEKTFEVGDIILREGGSDQPLFVLIEGTVEVFKADIPIAMVSQHGALFGEIAVLLDVPHIASVRVTERARMVVIDDGAALLASHPELALSVARLVAGRLRLITGYLADLRQQFDEHDDHLGMISEVMEGLLNAPLRDSALTPGSDREREPNEVGSGQLT